MPPNKLVTMLFLLVITAFPASAKQPLTPEQIIAQCEEKSGVDRFKLHRCLLGEYERLQKKTDILTDKLLGRVGAQRSYGRLKIIQWSNAITKSQSRWQKLVPWDCEWEGHVLSNPKGAAVAIDRCGIKRAARRVQLLENRLEALNTVIMRDKKKEN